MTDTALAAGIKQRWQQENLPWNDVSAVAAVIVDTLRSGELSGKALFVEGGRAWEIQDNLDRLESQWLGEEQSKDYARGNLVYMNEVRLRRKQADTEM